MDTWEFEDKLDVYNEELDNWFEVINKSEREESLLDESEQNDNNTETELDKNSPEYQKQL